MNNLLPVQGIQGVFSSGVSLFQSQVLKPLTDQQRKVAAIFAAFVLAVAIVVFSWRCYNAKKDPNDAAANKAAGQQDKIDPKKVDDKKVDDKKVDDKVVGAKNDEKKAEDADKIAADDLAEKKAAEKQLKMQQKKQLMT